MQEKEKFLRICKGMIYFKMIETNLELKRLILDGGRGIGEYVIRYRKNL